MACNGNAPEESFIISASFACISSVRCCLNWASLPESISMIAWRGDWLAELRCSAPHIAASIMQRTITRKPQWSIQAFPASYVDASLAAKKGGLQRKTRPDRSEEHTSELQSHS